MGEVKKQSTALQYNCFEKKKKKKETSYFSLQNLGGLEAPISYKDGADLRA